MVRPVYPIFEYYVNYDFIVSVLCENKEEVTLDCNGKCYLKKQLKKQQTPREENFPNLLSIDLDKYPVSPLGLDTFNLDLLNYKKGNQYSIKVGKTARYIAQVFHPPSTSFL